MHFNFKKLMFFQLIIECKVHLDAKSTLVEVLFKTIVILQERWFAV